MGYLRLSYAKNLVKHFINKYIKKSNLISSEEFETSDGNPTENDNEAKLSTIVCEQYLPTTNNLLFIYRNRQTVVPYFIVDNGKILYS